MSADRCGPELTWDYEECPRCGGRLMHADRLNVCCEDCDASWTHIKNDRRHALQTADGEIEATMNREGVKIDAE